jgi:hypothetical protein
MAAPANPRGATARDRRLRAVTDEPVETDEMAGASATGRRMSPTFSSITQS